jgi:hypothetical protein
MQLKDDWPASYTFGNTTAWESENDWPIAEFMADMHQALDRLECPSAGDKSSSRGFIPVRRHCFVWSFAHIWFTITPFHTALSTAFRVY